jgi:hypothetical protein
MVLQISKLQIVSFNLQDVDIQTKVRRLSHEPFEYVITANSNKDMTAVARIFLAPKYNWFGEKLSLDKMRWNTIELDKFTVKLNPGQVRTHTWMYQLKTFDKVLRR